MNLSVPNAYVENTPFFMKVKFKLCLACCPYSPTGFLIFLIKFMNLEFLPIIKIKNNTCALQIISLPNDMKCLYLQYSLFNVVSLECQKYNFLSYKYYLVLLSKEYINKYLCQNLKYIVSAKKWPQSCGYNWWNFLRSKQFHCNHDEWWHLQ